MEMVRLKDLEDYGNFLGPASLQMAFLGFFLDFPWISPLCLSYILGNGQDRCGTMHAKFALMKHH